MRNGLDVINKRRRAQYATASIAELRAERADLAAIPPPSIRSLAAALAETIADIDAELAWREEAQPEVRS